MLRNLKELINESLGIEEEQVLCCLCSVPVVGVKFGCLVFCPECADEDEYSSDGLEEELDMWLEGTSYLSYECSTHPVTLGI